MRRLIIGGAALVTGAVTALAVALGLRHRRGRREDVPALEPASPAAPAKATTAKAKATTPANAAAEDPSVEADFGAIAAEAGSPPTANRRRPRRKPSGATTRSAAAAASKATTKSTTAAPAAATPKPRARRKPAPAAGSTDPGATADPAAGPATPAPGTRDHGRELTRPPASRAALTGLPRAGRHGCWPGRIGPSHDEPSPVVAHPRPWPDEAVRRLHRRRRHRLRRRARRGVRLPRPERRRQDLDDADDRLRVAGHRGHLERARAWTRPSTARGSGRGSASCPSRTPSTWS